ncbi:hypothetical protein, partial [Escherichia coli]|uniref:hypothetical protein n=1 Tax=Escherichia coli TaxID=562 RepID=UPI001F4B3DFA
MTAWITRIKSTDVLQLFSITINPTTEKTVITITAAYISIIGFAPIFPDTCYHLTHYWPAAADIPV